MRVLVYDTETTGLFPRVPLEYAHLAEWPHIVQLAWNIYEVSNAAASDECPTPVKTCSYLIRPDGFAIPEEASKIHHITTQRALLEGRPLQQVLTEWTEDAAGCHVLAAHNIEYDRTMILVEWMRQGVQWKHRRGGSEVCTMHASTMLCQLPAQRAYPDGSPYKQPRLIELCRRLFPGEYPDPAVAAAEGGVQRWHDAMWDVECAARCFFRLCHIGAIRLPAYR
jgi:DNA polymerase III epsilon subunit-like protein